MNCRSKTPPACLKAQRANKKNLVRCIHAFVESKQEFANWIKNIVMYAEILKILTLSMANFHCPKLGSAIIPTMSSRDIDNLNETYEKIPLPDFGQGYYTAPNIENQDFVRFHKKMKANNATMIDYYITLDMAKELSMVELLIVTGLRTVLSSMILLKIKTFWSLLKKK